MHNKIQHKGIKKKYKRIMATVAGAAVITSAMLPGMPLAKAQASANHNNTNHHRSDISQGEIGSRDAGDPVQIVKDNAGSFGFDTNASFSLLSSSGRKAVVRVHSRGQTFKVDLYQRNGEWIISTIHGIGDSTHPATYTTASMFNYQPNVTYPATLAANQHVLYQTNIFDDWFWHKNAYPQDMALGVLLQNPRLSDTNNIFSSDVLKQIDNINFGRQLVLYTHLGSVASKGYGIGIAKVAQTGNDLTVTVRTKSPLVNTALSATKADDLIPIDLVNLDFRSSIHITFVDQNGTVLSKNTIMPH